MQLPQIVDTHQTGYTLFQQAIVHQDAEAWEALCAQYRPLLIRWVNQCPTSNSVDESSLDLADQALARVGRAHASQFRQVRQSCSPAGLSAYMCDDRRD